VVFFITGVFPEAFAEPGSAPSRIATTVSSTPDVGRETWLFGFLKGRQNAMKYPEEASAVAGGRLCTIWFCIPHQKEL
jgi:hypothetical protein